MLGDHLGVAGVAGRVYIADREFMAGVDGPISRQLDPGPVPREASAELVAWEDIPPYGDFKCSRIKSRDGLREVAQEDM